MNTEQGYEYDGEYDKVDTNSYEVNNQDDDFNDDDDEPEVPQQELNRRLKHGYFYEQPWLNDEDFM